MKSILAIMAAATPLLLAGPAHAATPEPAQVVFAYDAPRHDYAQTMVMYVPGFLPEARRLARDLAVRLVAPVDGLTPTRLRGSKLVVLLGS